MDTLLTHIRLQLQLQRPLFGVVIHMVEGRVSRGQACPPRLRGGAQRPQNFGTPTGAPIRFDIER